MSDSAMTHANDAPATVDRLFQRGALIGGIGLVAALVGAFVNPAVFYQGYLVAFIFWTGLSLGALALLMIHHLSGGQWGLVIRRQLEAATRVLPAMAVLFVPLIFGVHYIYEWSHADVVAADPVLAQKAAFLNTPFWVVRTIVYFAIWSTMAFLLSKWSADQDARGDAPPDPRFGRLSGPGLVVYGITVSLASVDWMMSVDPHWFSTIYGFVMMAGQGLSALALVIFTLALLANERPLAGVARSSHFHDLGKLLFAFVMLYAYLIFSQFLIIWSANLPEEIPWYIKRFSGGWQYLVALLVVGHFILPFVILLNADVKKNVRLLTSIALLLFVMRILEVFFQVVPQFRPGLSFHWIDVAVVAAMGGIWTALYARNLKRRAVLPVNDPYYKEAFAHHGTH